MPEERNVVELGGGLYDEFEDEYDPLAADDSIIDQDDMDDDNPYDTVDFPTLRNMPAELSRESVYTPEHAGSVQDAVYSLVDHNPGRRKVLLAIVDMCRDGLPASQVSERVDALQKDNRSVFAPMTLCRMLGRAGALTLEMPETAEEVEDVENNVEYLEIKETVDPVWRSTAEGLEAYDGLTQGAAFRDIVLDKDSRYLEVYRAVMEATADGGRSKLQIEQLVDSFPIVQNPRRFGGHFIDMLERTDAIEWKDRAWHITDLGRSMLAEMAQPSDVEGEAR